MNDRPGGFCYCDRLIAQKRVRVRDIVECEGCQEEHSKNCYLIDETFILNWLCENCVYEQFKKSIRS